MMEAPRLAREGQRHVFVRDMVLAASIGVYPHEHQARQRILVNLELAVADGGAVESVAGSARAGLSRAGMTSGASSTTRPLCPRCARSWPPGTSCWSKPWQSASRKLAWPILVSCLRECGSRNWTCLMTSPRSGSKSNAAV